MQARFPSVVTDDQTGHTVDCNSNLNILPLAVAHKYTLTETRGNR